LSSSFKVEEKKCVALKKLIFFLSTLAAGHRAQENKNNRKICKNYDCCFYQLQSNVASTMQTVNGRRRSANFSIFFFFLMLDFLANSLLLAKSS
jgi:hypothetical protein